MAVVESVDEAHGLYLNSYAASPEEYWAGTTYDAVVWAPQEGANGFIAITNTSTEAHVVHTTFLVNGRSEEQPQMQIPPRHTQFLPIQDLLARSKRSGAGIHLEMEQDAGENYAGAILVEGQVFDRKTGFTKHVHFMDKALQFPTGTLRSHFLLLGSQPREDGYPANISFHSVAAVRNLDAAPVKVTPTVRFLRNGSLQTASLPAIVLAVAETRIIDFSEEQEAGHLPLDFHQGSVELAPDTGRASIVGELFNFNNGGGYVVGPSFTSYPTRSTASIWRTDGTFQTSIMVENTATDDDHVTLKLFSDTATYTKTFDISAGGLLKINIKNLQQEAIPDDNGNLLAANSGVLHILGSHSRLSQLSYEKIIHSTEEADYIGLPPNQCDYMTAIGLFVDDSSGTPPFPLMLDCAWALSGDTYEVAAGSYSNDSSLAQVSNDGFGDMMTLTPPDDDQDHFVSIGHDITVGAICDACSGGNFNVTPVSAKVRHANTYFKNPVQSNQGCFYGATACSSGKPSCTAQVGFAMFFSCPAYMHSKYVVFNGKCEFSIDTTASGPGPCD